MSNQTPLEKAKYGLLKAIDVSGFRVFDPVVRLCFGEEPKKQLGDITRYMLMPIVFVCCCLLLWNFIAPRHKTKSGEVPTPARVWDALVVNHRIYQRENEKQSDFELPAEKTEARIEKITAIIAEKETELAELREVVPGIKEKAKAEIAKASDPLKAAYDELKANNKSAKSDRDKAAVEHSEQVAKQESTREELLDLLRAQSETATEIKTAEKKANALKQSQVNAIKYDAEKSVKAAQLAADSAATELQHLKKRIDFLGPANRAKKVAEAESAAAESLALLQTADESTVILDTAKSIVKSEIKAKKIGAQEYPRASTIWLQTWRSLFTVFVGFILAAAVAIPVGIMCGLNKVVMACLTPLISIFKPVSPVVWLLIFQIVVGAFFPNPDTHPLFVFLNSLPLIKDLSVNPALIYSACTVAMCAVWPALVNTALGVSSVEQDHINVAKVLKLGLWARLTKIIIPSSLPLVFAGLRISLGVGWMVLIAAEALSSSNGLGKFVWDEYQNGSSNTFANILLACFLIGIIGFFLDRMMIVLQRSVSFGEDGAAVV